MECFCCFLLQFEFKSRFTVFCLFLCRQGYFFIALFNVVVTVVTVALFLAVLVVIHRRVSQSTRYLPALPDTPTSFIEMFTPPPLAAVSPLVDALGDGGFNLSEALELQTPPPPPPRTPRRSLRPTKGIPPARLDVSFSSF